MFSHVKKKQYVQSEWPTMFFHLWEKWYVQSKATAVCEFRSKIPALYKRFQLAAPPICELLCLSIYTSVASINTVVLKT